MANINDITNAMNEVRTSIDRVMNVSKYMEYDDLSDINIDYTDADQLLLVDEYRSILEKLESVNIRMKYLELPIKEVSTLHLNASGRYETENGYSYTSGNIIEYLVSDDYHDYPYWSISRVEHNGNDYYIVYDKELSMSRLKVRVRK
ncbi:MAG: DUF5348 domain-containing protein [Sedimentibacter sp.]